MSGIETNNVVERLIWNLEQAVEYDTRLQETEGVSAVAICTAGERRLAARQSLSDRIDELEGAGNTLAESVRIIKAALTASLPRRELELLMNDLHAWNVASLTQGGKTNG